MRLSKKRPEAGSIRIKKWFAIFPVSIKGEFRWMETVFVKQHYYKPLDLYWTWENCEFINEPVNTL